MNARFYPLLLRLMLVVVGGTLMSSCVGPGYYYRDRHYRDRDYDHGRRHHYHRSHHYDRDWR